MAMNPPLKSLFKPPEERLMDAVADALQEEAWDVQREPIVGTLRPDLVARRPDGQSYVIEVKRSTVTANLGAVAQVEAYRNALAQRGDREAKGLLVVSGVAPEALGDAAERAGVVVVRTGSVDSNAVHEALAQAGIFGSRATSAHNGGAQAD
jgi:RecB family endonuclease NucS